MTVKIGGGYVENEDHVPNPTDMVGTFNTSGLGAHQRIEEVAPVFEVDKHQTAKQIVAALDPDDTTVSSDKVLLPEDISRDDAKETLLKAAKARASEDVVVGGPTPAQREAEEETEGEVRAESNSASTSSVETGSDSEKSDKDESGDDTKKTAAAKKTAASSK